MLRTKACVLAGLGLLLAAQGNSQVCNIKIVTDASPDYHDMDGLIRSTTSRWETTEEKCWALFYWNHIARRQTSPMILHGLELSDPIRQFNDYGYTQCSTVAGINCSIWDAMGLEVKYWDITLHTVPEVEYGGRWHMYDNSMSAIYTLCDGKTIAGVEDIGKDGACEASGGKVEPGHIARYHCLNATSRNGFLTGADCTRDLAQEHGCFRPSGLKYRYYFNDWDRGHRYILTLRSGEVYTRYYKSCGSTPEYFVPNHGDDPEKPNPRYGIRGNGVRLFKPRLDRECLTAAAHWLSGVEPAEPEGVRPGKAGEPGEIVFKVEGANVIASLRIKALFERKDPDDLNSVSLSVTNGLSWKEVWRNEATGKTDLDLKLLSEVNGSYEVLVKVTLAGDAPSDAVLRHIELETITMLNSKTQPRLNLGKNRIHVGAGDRTESIVFWPDLEADSYKPYILEEENIASEPEHPGYQGVLHAARGGKEAHVTFRIESPRDVKRITYGGRLYNRAPKSHIDFLHSFDAGKTWTRSYRLSATDPPWDVIHYETIDAVPPGTRSVLFKYLIEGPTAGKDACSIYAVRMEVNHEPAEPKFEPLVVTWSWLEAGKDRSLVKRSHTEIVPSVPHEYEVHVGGEDHPVMDSLRVGRRDALPELQIGYSDGKDAGGDKFVHRWMTCGRNLAEGKPYTVSVPSRNDWSAGDPEGKKLTDGIVGPPYAGGTTPSFGCCWAEGTRPVVTVDLGAAASCGAFRIHLSGGWPWWDALKGEVKDTVEVETSVDGTAYVSQGNFNTDLRWKDIPVNHLMPDDETATGFLFELVPPKPAEARYVRFKITPARILIVSEVQVLDGVRYEPFDLRIALPGTEKASSGGWRPLFQGIEYLETERREPRRLNLHALRVDLKDPDIRFVVTPSNGDRPGETDGETASSFLKRQKCQVAVNASPYQPVAQKEGDPKDVLGLSMSDGDLYSKAQGEYGALLLGKDNKAWISTPPFDTGRAHNAVGGFGLLLEDGVNVGSKDALHPRTAVGVSRDGRHLIILVLDGRQPGYSEGATTAETADFLKELGAHSGLNMDGGGSTALVISDGKDGARSLNRSIHAGVPGLQRVNANHLGIRARPLSPEKESSP